MEEWKCQSCGKINEVSLDELEINEEYKCSCCSALHIIELLCNDEITVEMF